MHLVSYFTFLPQDLKTAFYKKSDCDISPFHKRIKELQKSCFTAAPPYQMLKNKQPWDLASDSRYDQVEPKFEVRGDHIHVSGTKSCAFTLLFCSSRVRCSKQLLLRKMACSTGLSEHRNMSLIVSERQEEVES